MTATQERRALTQEAGETALAEEGLVTSYWSTPDRGPARRVYAITGQGEQHLEQSMSALAGLLHTVRGMLKRFRNQS